MHGGHMQCQLHHGEHMQRQLHHAHAAGRLDFLPQRRGFLAAWSPQLLLPGCALHGAAVLPSVYLQVL
jgi:hypothetical protein